MNWNDLVEKITPYIVKVETPDGHGTGFLCLYNEDHGICGVATAKHVVEHADQWQQPVRILKPRTGEFYFAKENERVILLDETDSAVILFFNSIHEKLKFPQDLVPLLPSDKNIPIGVEVGWLGFPSVDPSTLCFFSGNISAKKTSSYLIDGVAINGVSGGPVIYSTGADGLQIVGNISAYMPNRASSGVLPGLCIAQDVSHFNTTAQFIKSIDDARRQKREAELAQAQKNAEPTPAPELAPPKQAPE